MIQYIPKNKLDERDLMLKVEALAYRLISVPQIYYDSSYLLTIVNAMFLSLWLFMCWATPTCWTFDDFDKPFFSACFMISDHWELITFICLIDFVFELFLACPSTGISVIHTPYLNNITSVSYKLDKTYDLDSKTQERITRLRMV